MKKKSPKKSISKALEARENRLKSALKANIAKRKKQARHRAAAFGRNHATKAEASGE